MSTRSEKIGAIFTLLFSDLFGKCADSRLEALKKYVRM